MLTKAGTSERTHTNSSTKLMFDAKRNMSKKLFGWTSSSKKSNKMLATDAAPLEENHQTAGDSSERTQSSALSISPSTPEIGLSRQFDTEPNMSVARTNDSLVEPLYTPNHNNALSLSNNQQYVYNFTNSVGVHFGPNIQINNNAEPSLDVRTNSRDGIPRTTSIDAMMRSTDPVNERVMDVISTHLGENWRTLFRRLDFSDGQIDQMKEDYHVNGVKEVIYRLLLDYSRNNDDASLAHISTVMWKLGFRECVRILKDHWKDWKRDDLAMETETNNSGNGCGKGPKAKRFR